jgi:hypothetical protein
MNVIPSIQDLFRLRNYARTMSVYWNNRAKQMECAIAGIEAAVELKEPSFPLLDGKPEIEKIEIEKNETVKFEAQRDDKRFRKRPYAPKGGAPKAIIDLKSKLPQLSVQVVRDVYRMESGGQELTEVAAKQALLYLFKKNVLHRVSRGTYEWNGKEVN